MSRTQSVKTIVGGRRLAAILRKIFVQRGSSLARMYYHKSLAQSSKWIDRMLDIDTVSLPVKTIDHPTKFGDSHSNIPYSYLKLWSYSNWLKPSSDDIVFDIGCGAGRILCFFARQPVRKCVGIEVSTDYAQRARQNAKQLRGRKAPIEIRICDATEADYSEGTIYCLFNPFGTKTLQAVLERIHKSVRKYPRRIQIAYFNSAFEDVLESCSWLSCYRRSKSIMAKRWGTTTLWTN
jgi:precorrin-6B methylase 2